MLLENLIISPVSCLEGSINLPGDKSITHRALMLSAISDFTVVIQNALFSADTFATQNILKNLSVPIEVGETLFKVEGVGLHGLTKSSSVLDAGNSGTCMRLMTGILAAQQFDSVITGDSSLCTRPMQRIIQPLTLMGACIEANAGNYAPLHIFGRQNLQAINYQLPIASAQIKSAILLAGLYTQTKCTVTERNLSRNHTEIMLDFFAQQSRLRKNITLQIPGDISSAAFFLVAGSIVANSQLELLNVGINQTRAGILHVLTAMGADIKIINQHEVNGELIADLRVRTSKLKSIVVPENLIPNIIDEIPILAVAAACAVGTTVIRGAQELRHKESDRIKAIIAGLSNLGIKTAEFADGLAITGGIILGGRVNSFGDHRIAMAFAIAGMVAKQPVIVQDTHNIATSFPNFVVTAQKIGAIITHSRGELDTNEELYGEICASIND